MRKSMITRMYAVWVYVKDKEESSDFYENVLGLKVKRKEGNWVEFDLGRTAFALLEKEKSKEVKPQKTRIMFEVEDLEEMKQLLHKKKVKIVKIREESYGKLLTFEDPNGHWLELFEPKSKDN